MPTTDTGKTIAARNATTHGLFSRDIVLPALGEDPEGYQQLEAQWMKQLPPRTLLERHYVEKIAAASWRLRRLHRWQAQILENNALTEDEQLDKLAKVLRHETTLHRQIDTSVRMLSKDAPQLYALRAKDAAMDSTQTTQREYESNQEEAVNVELKAQDHLRRIRFDTEAAGLTLADAPLDAVAQEVPESGGLPGSQCCVGTETNENCENELRAISLNPFRLSEYLDPSHSHHPLPFSPPPGHAAKTTRTRLLRAMEQKQHK